MKVNLAAQTPSSSVADALEYCEGKLQGMPQFKACSPTVKFICTFDRFFDILNSRNPLANNFNPLVPMLNVAFLRQHFKKVVPSAVFDRFLKVICC